MLSTPKTITFWIAVILAILGLIFFFVPFLGGYAFGFMLVAFVILLLGNLIEGM